MGPLATVHGWGSGEASGFRGSGRCAKARVTCELRKFPEKFGARSHPPCQQPVPTLDTTQCLVSEISVLFDTKRTRMILDSLGNSVYIMFSLVSLFDKRQSREISNSCFPSISPFFQPVFLFMFPSLFFLAIFQSSNAQLYE